MKRILTLIAIAALALYLRVVGITLSPPSLYWEEVALGVDAYSLLMTGRDHHGNPWPVIGLESFGDWKPVGYVYALMPSIGLLGLTEFAVRVPSLLAGLSLVPALYVLAKAYRLDPRIGALLAAISPWAVWFSRGGWESNLATALTTWGVIMILPLSHRSIQNIPRTQLFAGIVLFAASAYTYHAHRLVVPALLAALLVLQLLNHGMRASLKGVLIVGTVFSLLLAPLVLNASNPEVNHRFSSSSIFSDTDLIIESNARQQAAHSSVGRLLGHRYLVYGREILSGWLSHFDPSYLFVSGDTNPRHSIQYFGHLYHIEFVFFLLGVGWSVRRGSSKKAFLWWWIIVGILPASLVRGTPHALRTLVVMPAVLLLVTAGLDQTLGWIKKHRSALLQWGMMSILIGLYALEVSVFWTYLTQAYPARYAHEWQFGYRQMIWEVHRLEQLYPNARVIIDRSVGRPAMYYWFYTQTPPQEVQNENDRAIKDQGEYLTYKQVQFGPLPLEVQLDTAETTGEIRSQYGPEGWEVQYSANP